MLSSYIFKKRKNVLLILYLYLIKHYACMYYNTIYNTLIY